MADCSTADATSVLISSSLAKQRGRRMSACLISGCGSSGSHRNSICGETYKDHTARISWLRLVISGVRLMGLANAGTHSRYHLVRILPARQGDVVRFDSSESHSFKGIMKKISKEQRRRIEEAEEKQEISVSFPGLGAYSYRKVKRGEPGYELIQDAKNRGTWICDSYDHNENEGCSNPDCFKHPNYKDRRWAPPPVLGDV